MEPFSPRPLTPEEEAAAILESWSSFWEFYARRNPRATLLRFEGARALSFGLPHPLFNQVYLAEPTITLEQVVLIRDAMNARRLPWLWVGDPSARENALASKLTACGLVRAFVNRGMILDTAARGVDAVMPPALDVREVTDGGTLQAFLQAMLPAYDMPPSFGEFFTAAHDPHGFFPRFPARLYYGIHQGRPVTASLVYFDDRAAVIQCVGTLAGARGRGFGSAIVRACLLAAREQGYRYAVLHASAMGHPIYLRLGFEDRFEQPFYMVPPLA